MSGFDNFGQAAQSAVGTKVSLPGVANKLTDTLGFTNPAAKGAANAVSSSLNTENKANTGVLANMAQNNAGYSQAAGGISNAQTAATQANTAPAVQQSKDLANSAAQQASDASKTYTNNLLPAQQNLMNQANTNAGQAMSLSQAMDPNNAVASGVRNMYSQQAQGAEQAGLADVGVINAMGSQATQQAMQGGQPMTGGQLQAIQGANLGQGAQAMANVQKHMQNLQEQGINAGMNQSNAMYGAGQQANQAAQQAGANYGNMFGQGQGLQQNAQGIQNQMNMQGYGLNQANINNNFAQNMGMAGLNNQLGNQVDENQLAINNQYYGGQQGLAGAQMQGAYGNQAGMLGMMTGLGSAAIGAAGRSGNNSGGGG